MIIHTLNGFGNYIIKDNILYRKAHRVKDKLCKFKYLSDRKIKKTFKGQIEGYYLVRNRKRRFYSLKSLKHRLKLLE